MADDEIWMTPLMTGVPAVVSEGVGAISNFPEGFAGLMIGAQHMPGHEPMIVIGVLDRDGRFLAAATCKPFYLRFRELLDETIAAIDRGDFDKPPVAS